MASCPVIGGQDSVPGFMSGRLDSIALITPCAMPSYGVSTASSFLPLA